MKTNLTHFLRKMSMSVFAGVMLFLISVPAIGQTFVTVGTGTSAQQYPFYSYWHDGKTEMIYTAAEITAANGASGTISSIAFDVTSIGGQALTGLTIEMMNTTQSTLTGFNTSGWTTVYSATYNVTATGWNTFTLTTPFYYDGTNLSVKVCFDNTSYTSSTQVNCSAVPSGTTWEQHADNSAGCSFSGGSAQAYRPNAKFAISMAPPSQTDLGVMAWDYPYTGCGMTATEPVTIKVKNYGTVTQSTYSLKYSVDNGTSWTTQAMTTPILPGDTLTHTFTATASFATAGTYNCLATVILPLDSNSANDTLSNTVVSVAGLALPYFTDIENWTVGTITTSGYDWYRSSAVPNWEVEDATGANENSTGTGPYYDHTSEGTSGGKYVYLETSSGSTNDISYLTSPCANFGNATTVIMKFWYHMYGATMGTLEVEQKVGGVWVTTGWSMTGEQHTTGDAAWSEAVVPLNPAAEAIRFKGTRGTSYTGDMSIDDITIYVPQPNDLALIEWTNPISGIAPSASVPITVKVVNAGIADQDTFDLKYSIDGGTTIITETYNDTLAVGDTLTYTFTALANMNTAGLYNCGAAVINAGDSYTGNDSIFADIWTGLPLSGTYTIGLDATDDFASFSDAVLVLNLFGVSGSCTFIADSGTYNEQVVLNEIVGASSTNTIKFTSATGNAADVVLTNSASGSSDNFTVKLDGADYISFINMTIAATNSSYATVIEVTNGANYNTFYGNNIQSTGTSSSSRCIYDYNTINEFNTYRKNIITDGYYGFYVYGTNSSTWEKGTVIDSNDISGFYYYGIYSYYQDSIQITNNNIHDPVYGYYGIYTYYNFNGFNFSNNNIVMNGSSSTVYAFRVYFCNYYSYAGTSAAGLVSNNMISIPNATSTKYGLYAYYSNNVLYANNSVLISSGGTGYPLYCGNTSSNTAGQTFKNNNFVNKGGSYAAYFANTTSIAGLDYNNYYTTGSSLAYYSGAKADLAAFQTASSMDANSVSIDPMFPSTTDLHVNYNLFDNLGTSLTEVTIDIDGDTRSLTTPDIGADEFTPVANDLSATELIAPMSGMCGNTLEPVIAVITNLGYATQTAVPVTAKITTPSGIVTLNTIISSIAGYGKDTVTIGTFNYTAPGAYSAKIYATLATDAKPINDTLVSSFEMATPFAVEHIEMFEDNGINWAGNMYVASGAGLTGDALHFNLYSSSSYQNCYSQMTKKVGPIPANAKLVFDYQLLDYATTNGHVLDGDTLIFAVSNDCGNTFMPLMLIDTNSHVTTDNYTHKIIDLSAYLGDEIILAFAGQWAAGDYDVNIDNFGVALPATVDLGVDTAICAGNSITFDAGSGLGYAYIWTYGGDTIANTSTLMTDSAGTYIVEVIAPAGSVFDTIVLGVNPLPVVSFTGLSAMYCNDEIAATLTGTPANGTFTGNGITANMFDPATAGLGVSVINYSFTDANNCSSDINDTTMVYEAAVAVMSMDTAICEGESVMISAGSASAAPSLIFSSYIEGTSNNKGIELFNATNDTLDLANYRIAQSTNGGGWAFYHTFPVGATLAPNTTWVMVTNQVSFATTGYDTANADEVLSYPSVVHHNGDDARGIEVTADAGTTWTLIDLIGDPNNDPGSGWDVAGVSAATANHTMKRKSNIIGGDTNWTMVAGADSLSSQYLVYPVNTFSMLGSHTVMAATAPTYTWSNGGSTATITVSPTATTVYTVTVSNANCSVIDSVEVTVNMLPVVNLGPDDSFKSTAGSITLDAGNPNASWTWSTGDLTQTVLLNSGNMSTGANTVSVLVTENGCSASDTVVITMIDDVSIENALNNVEMNIYPNPTSGVFTMTINGFSGQINMEIVNLTGQVVYTEKLDAKINFNANFDMRTLAKGVYYIKLSNNTGVKTQKLIIK